MLKISLVVVAATLLQLPGISMCYANPVGLKLTQRAKQNGDETIWLSPLGIRVESAKSGTITVCRSPKWTIYKFNPHTKTFCETPLNKFENRLTLMQAVTGGAILDDATIKKIGTTQFLGREAVIYSSDGAFSAKAINMHERRNVTDSFPKTFEMTVLPCPFPVEEAHVLSVLHGSPHTPNIPVDVTCHDFKKKTYKFVSTYLIEDALLDPAKLEVPPYRKVKNESDLLVDLNEDPDLMNLIRDRK